MYIQVNDNDLQEYFNDKISITKPNEDEDELNIVSEENDSNKYIECDTLPNNVDEFDISISDNKFKVKETDIEITNPSEDSQYQYKDLSFKIKLNNDNEQLSWEITISNYKFRAPKPNSGDDPNNGENGGEGDNTENP